MPKAVFESSFDLPEEGTYLGRIFEVPFETDTKGLSGRVRVEIIDGIEHEECNQMKVMDNFPLYANFGVSRLLGTLIKTGAKLDANKDYPVDFFNNEKQQNTAIRQLLEKEYGFTIKHNKIEGREKPVANIILVMSKDEYMTKKKNYVGPVSKGGKPASVATETKTGDAATTKEIDEWG
jgi:hypothetical protein